jgi:hypothetical protein
MMWTVIKQVTALPISPNNKNVPKTMQFHFASKVMLATLKAIMGARNANISSFASGWFSLSF